MVNQRDNQLSVRVFSGSAEFSKRVGVSFFAIARYKREIARAIRLSCNTNLPDALRFSRVPNQELILME